MGKPLHCKKHRRSTDPKSQTRLASSRTTEHQHLPSWSHNIHVHTAWLKTTSTAVAKTEKKTRDRTDAAQLAWPDPDLTSGTQVTTYTLMIASLSMYIIHTKKSKYVRRQPTRRTELYERKIGWYLHIHTHRLSLPSTHWLTDINQYYLASRYCRR